MGRKARTKQGVPAPITDADIAKLRKNGAGGAAKGKKSSSAKPAAAAPIKAKLPAKTKKRVKAVDVVDDDSDAEEALEQG
jgi:hypothetical protein